MFGTLKFTNVFALIDNGVVTGVQSVGSISGSAIQLGGTAPLRRFVHILEGASGTASTAVVKFYLATSTASGGTFVSLSQTSQIMSATGSNKWYMILDSNDTAFGDLATNALWYKTVTVVTTLALPIALTTLGYLSGSEPASNFNSSTLAFTSEVDFLA